MFTSSTAYNLPPQIQEDMSPLVLLSGVSHKQTNVSTRERLSINKAQLRPVLEEFLEFPALQEAVLISTCNRVELVSVLPAYGGIITEAKDHIEDTFSKIAGGAPKAFRNGFYHHSGADAVKHLFRVASGLDSLVVGEPQILGQLKRAYESASEYDTTSMILNKLFHKSFGVGKAIRTRTNIGRNPVSICYAARELAKHIFGDLREAQVMLIGAGDVGALSLKHFQSAGAKQIYVVNRTLERAVELATEFDAVALPMRKLAEFLPQIDIVIGASAIAVDDEPLIDADMVSEVLASRRGGPQFYIDLAVPRNFDSSIANVSDAFLYNVDDLDEIVKRNIDARELEVEEAELIVNDEVTKFSEWLERRSVDPAIRELVEWSLRIQKREIAKTMKRFRREKFTEKDCEMLESALKSLCSSVVAKTLHRPLSIVKKKGPEDDSLLSMFKEFFLGRR